MTATTPADQIRVSSTPDDFPGVAAVMTASDPEWPVTPELLATWVSSRDPQVYHADFVVERDGQIVAVGVVAEDDFASEPGKYWIDLHVHPSARRQGIGSALYAQLLQVLSERDARKVTVMAGEDKLESARFVQQRGFHDVWRRYESRLETASFDFTPFAPLEERLSLRGLQLVSIADLAMDPRRDERLFELDWLLMQDVPMGQQLTKRAFDTWRKQEIDDPHFELAGSFVALDPAREDELTGPYVGYSSLMSNPAGFYVIGMTGVLPTYRGLGIAKALKLRGTRFVQERGGGEIRTFNDPPNVAMLRMNEQLGFVRQPARVRYQLEF